MSQRFTIGDELGHHLLKHTEQFYAEPEERGRLQRLREAAGDVSKSVLAGAIVAAGKAAAGE